MLRSFEPSFVTTRSGKGGYPPQFRASSFFEADQVALHGGLTTPGIAVADRYHKRLQLLAASLWHSRQLRRHEAGAMGRRGQTRQDAGEQGVAGGLRDGRVDGLIDLDELFGGGGVELRVVSRPQGLKLRHGFRAGAQSRKTGAERLKRPTHLKEMEEELGIDAHGELQGREENVGVKRGHERPGAVSRLPRASARRMTRCATATRTTFRQKRASRDITVSFPPSSRCRPC